MLAWAIQSRAVPFLTSWSSVLPGKWSVLAIGLVQDSCQCPHNNHYLLAGFLPPYSRQCLEPGTPLTGISNPKVPDQQQASLGGCLWAHPETTALCSGSQVATIRPTVHLSIPGLKLCEGCVQGTLLESMLRVLWDKSCPCTPGVLGGPEHRHCQHGPNLLIGLSTGGAVLY